MLHAIDYIVSLDVAHPARKPDEVERELDAMLTKIRNHPGWRALKIVHGYGSSGKGGATKATVKNWAFSRRQHLRAIIEGERYELFNADTQKMRSECGQADDPDLGAANPGITVVWVK